MHCAISFVAEPSTSDMTHPAAAIYPSAYTHTHPPATVLGRSIRKINNNKYKIASILLANSSELRIAGLAGWKTLNWIESKHAEGKLWVRVHSENTVISVQRAVRFSQTSVSSMTGLARLHCNHIIIPNYFVVNKSISSGKKKARTLIPSARRLAIA